MRSQNKELGASQDVARDKPETTRPRGLMVIGRTLAFILSEVGNMEKAWAEE